MKVSPLCDRARTPQDAVPRRDDKLAAGQGFGEGGARFAQMLTGATLEGSPGPRSSSMLRGNSDRAHRYAGGGAAADPTSSSPPEGSPGRSDRMADADQSVSSRKETTVLDRPAECATLIADLLTLGACARREGPVPSERPGRWLPEAPHGLDPARVLLGHGPTGAEARVSISTGPLSGAEIHLRMGPNGVEAAFLTQVASSRQTLVKVMDEVARRLRQRGQNLQVRPLEAALHRRRDPLLDPR